MEVSYFSTKFLPVVIYLSVEEYNNLYLELDRVRSYSLLNINKLYKEMKSISKIVDK